MSERVPSIEGRLSVMPIARATHADLRPLTPLRFPCLLGSICRETSTYFTACERFIIQHHEGAWECAAWPSATDWQAWGVWMLEVGLAERGFSTRTAALGALHHALVDHGVLRASSPG